MDKYGIDNVRGGVYTQVKLSQEQLNEINRKLDSVNDRCYICHKNGHFASSCKGSVSSSGSGESKVCKGSGSTESKLLCTRCGRNTHLVSSCYAHSHINSSITIPPCTKCGRNNHDTSQCRVTIPFCTRCGDRNHIRSTCHAILPSTSTN